MREAAFAVSQWGFLAEFCIPKSPKFGSLPPYPRDPGSPKLRMVSWNVNTMHFVSVIGHPGASSSENMTRKMPRGIC